MEKLRLVNRAAAGLISGFRKFDHISHYMRDVLHWHPFPQRTSYRIASLVWRGLSGWAPSYLRELCRPLSSCAGRRKLWPSAHGNLVVPFARSATMQTRSFFCGWSKNLEWTSSRSKAPSKRCLFSIPPPSLDCSFPLGLGRERL